MIPTAMYLMLYAFYLLADSAYCQTFGPTWRLLRARIVVGIAIGALVVGIILEK